MSYVSRGLVCGAVALSLAIASCTPPIARDKKNEKTAAVTTTLEGVAMVVPYKITVGSALDDAGHKKVQGIIEATFAEINAIYNRWNPDSEVSHLNAAKAGEKLPVSVELETFLQETGHIVTLTEGRFDPTIEPLLALWKTKLEAGTTPAPEEIAALAPAIGWDKIHLEQGVFWKDNDRTALDLGGLAKGFAIDLLIDNLANAGYANTYVEWGGDIRTAGEHPDGRDWRVVIAGLKEAAIDRSMAPISLRDQAIATSGDYLQYWKIPNPAAKTNPKAPAELHYFHVINPFTFQPMLATYSSVASASVRANHCMLADGLATALMVFSSKAEAEIWMESLQLQLPELESWIITRNRSGEERVVAPITDDPSSKKQTS